MPFRIFAAGTGNFHFSRTNLDFGDVYDTASAMSQMQDLATGGVGGWAQGRGTDQVTPNPQQSALDAMGRIIGTHLLRDSVTLMVAQMGSVEVSVYARQTRTLWVDNTQFARVFLATDDDVPAGTFFRRVNPVLTETEMNTFGVLAAMAHAITQFTIDGRASNGVTMLNIQLFR